MKKLIFVLIIILLAFQVSSAVSLDTRKLIREAAQQSLRFEPGQSDSILSSDSVWNNWVNRGCLQLSMDANVVPKEILVYSSAGVWAVAVDTAILRINWVIKIQNKTMVPLLHWPPPFMEDKFNDTTLPLPEGGNSGGAPRGYWFNADSLHFFPPPIKEDTFLVGYVTRPRYMSADTSTTNIKPQYREAIVFYVCYLFNARVRRQAEADWWLAQYKGKVADYNARSYPPYDIIRSPDDK